MILLLRKRISENPVYPFPGRENLRAGKLARHSPSRVQDLSGRDLDTQVGRINSDATQRLDEIGLGHNAGTATGKLALHALEYLNVPPRAPQQQAGQ